mmetsp:Transcript_125332/g.244050  ORF Transcript_125332/g.244050 Transcript_125332/m.244050 type:complete len:317 (-) Transcript_125332:262-1212(-)
MRAALWIALSHYGFHVSAYKDGNCSNSGPYDEKHMGGIIDYERYPIHDLSGDAGRKLVEACRKAWKEEGTVSLEGFVSQDVMEQMAAEVANLPSHQRVDIVMPYTPYKFSAIDPKSFNNYTEGHPRRKIMAQDVYAAASDVIPKDALLRQFYHSQDLLVFLAAVLEIPKVYTFRDVLQSLNVHSMRDGCYRAWHYDMTDFATTLMLQPSLEGGEFEFVPFIREDDPSSETYENADEVAKLFNGTHPNIKTTRQAQGTLQLFNGKRSMHRVRMTYGPRPRLQGVLTYHVVPPEQQEVHTPEQNVALYGERVRTFRQT